MKVSSVLAFQTTLGLSPHPNSLGHLLWVDKHIPLVQDRQECYSWSAQHQKTLDANRKATKDKPKSAMISAECSAQEQQELPDNQGRQQHEQ
jgi:hypothetical protein